MDNFSELFYLMVELQQRHNGIINSSRYCARDHDHCEYKLHINQ